MYKPTVLRVMRTSQFKNQKEAAAAVGVSRTWYSLIETGSLKPTEEVCKKLESVFGIPSSNLLREISIAELINMGA